MTKNAEINDKSEQQHYIGHRQRLRERFLKDEGKSMADYELLELLLTLAIPRRDVKALAKNLIKDFGSFAKVINAPQYKLADYGLSQSTIAAFKVVVAAAIKMSWQELREKNDTVLSNFDYMIDYCKMALAHLEVEEFRVLFLNAHLKIIKEETMQRGTVNNVAVHPREVVKAALECGAMSVILFHNHPGGKASSSKNDMDVTKQICEALSPLGIKVQDHVIITADDYFSFRDNGLIK